MSALMGPHKQSNRAFGFTLTGLLLVISTVYYVVRREPLIPTLTAAGVLFTIALILPGLLWPFNRIWANTIARVMSGLLSHLTLIVMFFGVITPVALFFRLIGRDPLALKPSNQDSYLVPVETQTTEASMAEVF